MIEVKNLSVNFDGETVLQNINLTIKEGEYLLIIGKSGTGKSVLVKTILGLNKNHGGEILFDGKPLNKHKKQITSLVFQNSALLDSMTVFQNVALPLMENSRLKKSEIENEVQKVLTDLEIEEIASKMPSQISGGMKKRVAIARAIITKPKYIFYDEPTTGLDPQTTQNVLRIIKKIHNSGNITTIIITHDKRILSEKAARIILLKKPKIIFDGNYADLLSAKNNVISNYIRQDDEL